MDDRKLEVLIAAVDLGSFSKAARECHCTQSAVTQLVSSIEAELGCRLLIRSHAGVALTREGKAIMPDVREASDALDRLKRKAADLRAKRPVLRIGAYASVAADWIPRAMNLLRQGDLQVGLSLRVGSRNLADMLRKGSIDLAVCDDRLFREELQGNAGKPDYQWIPLAEDAFYYAVPAQSGFRDGQVVACDDLRGFSYIYDPDYVYASSEASRAASVVEVGADDSSSVLSLVASGVGVSLLPALSLNSIPEGVAVVRPDPPSARVLGVAMPSHPTAEMERFAHCLQQSVPTGLCAVR